MFQVADAAPLGPDQEEPESLELLSGHVPEDTAAKNQQALDLLLLQVLLPFFAETSTQPWPACLLPSS